MKIVHRCPVCNGAMTVPSGFYLGLTPVSLEREPCRSCNGTGIIWSEDVIPSYPIKSLDTGEHFQIVKTDEESD